MDIVQQGFENSYSLLYNQLLTIRRQKNYIKAHYALPEICD
jgi:hypothetical protein